MAVTAGGAAEMALTRLRLRPRRLSSLPLAWVLSEPSSLLCSDCIPIAYNMNTIVNPFFCEIAKNRKLPRPELPRNTFFKNLALQVGIFLTFGTIFGIINSIYILNTCGIFPEEASLWLKEA